MSSTSLSLQGDDVELLGRETPRQFLARFKKMTPAQRKKLWKSLTPIQKLGLAAVAPALLALIGASAPVLLPTAAAAGSTSVVVKKGKQLIAKFKKMTPAQRKAAWAKIPAWQKAIMLPALPALAALVAASLPVAMLTATAAATTPGVLPAAIAAARMKRQKEQTARKKAAVSAAAVKKVRLRVTPTSPGRVIVGKGNKYAYPVIPKTPTPSTSLETAPAELPELPETQIQEVAPKPNLLPIAGLAALALLL